MAFHPSRVDSDDEVLGPPSTQHSAFGARASDDAPSVAHSLTDVTKKFQFSFLHASLLLFHVMVNMRVLFCTMNFPFFSPDILCSLCPPPLLPSALQAPMSSRSSQVWLMLVCFYFFFIVAACSRPQLQCEHITNCRKLPEQACDLL